jgi:rhodanese-related sulfurtransferase
MKEAHTKLLLVALIASVVLSACGGATPTPEATAIPSPTPVPPTATPMPPTEAPEPTATTEPSPTPEPTAEPEPEAGAEAGELALLSEQITAELAEWKPVITADALFENLNDGDETNDPFVLSVRSREHYELGHIPGAYNIPWREIANPENLSALPTDRQIVVYCYTGHTGQVAATVLNALGYDVTNLKFGMMGWTDDADVLATDPFAAAAGYPVEAEPNALTESYELPELATGEADAAAIVQARAQAFLAEWKPVTTVDALFENLNDGDEGNDPFVLSVRSPEHYEVGHIAGAYNIPWREVAKTENLEQLPADAQIVGYCYTGHTGQVAATVLGLMGYDVTNLKFGMMGWTDDADVLATEPFAAPAAYPVETEVNELTGAEGASDADEFTALAELVTAELGEWKPVISADALFENLSDGDESNDPFVLSVRSREHYELGHLPGAYNIPWREIAADDNLAYLPTDRQIVVYCYTGHTGQVAATILNVLGYDVTNLKFGMMGWTDDAEVLATDPFGSAAGYPVETEANALTETYETPALETGETDPTAVARARAQAFLAEWKPVTTSDALFENLSDGDEGNDPFVLSVRAPEHYEIGHVGGAYNIPWREVAKTDNLEQLPADAPIVAYCYTGHTGQVGATVLGLLGYDVTNLKFGMMAWTDDAEVLSTDPFAAPAGYPVETEVNELG